MQTFWSLNVLYYTIAMLIKDTDLLKVGMHA